MSGGIKINAFPTAVVPGETWMDHMPGVQRRGPLSFIGYFDDHELALTIYPPAPGVSTAIVGAFSIWFPSHPWHGAGVYLTQET